MEEHVVQEPQKGKGKWILLAVLLALPALAALVLFGVNRFYLTVTPVGESAMTIEYGEEYQELGAQVKLHGTLFLQSGIPWEDAVVTQSGEVDVSALGEYTVDYGTELQWMTATARRTVQVVDTRPPEIKLVADPYAEHKEGVQYKEEGFTATDNYDGDLTDKVERQELYGLVVYKVTDSSGNTATAEREVPLFDKTPPTILLEGEKFYRHQIGRAFVEPGFLALDNLDGDLTEQVIIKGDVDCFATGVYPITYTVSDEHGNWGFQTRSVEIVKRPRVDVKVPEGKVIYLTFDDGPGPYTEQLLDVLAQYGVKATFFVTDSGYGDIMRRIVEEGHAIGIHTIDHDYDKIYQNRESYFADLYGMQDIIYEETGFMTTLMRFPGGGSNLVSRRLYKGLMQYLTVAVQDAGFQYFDWNVDSNDAGGALTKETVAANVIAGVQEQRVSVVLQHDIHPYSVEAVEEILVWGLDNGYTFLPLQEDSPTFHHPVYN